MKIKNTVTLVEVDTVRGTVRIHEAGSDTIQRVSLAQLTRLEEKYPAEFAGCERTEMDMTPDALRDGHRMENVTVRTTLNPIN